MLRYPDPTAAAQALAARVAAQIESAPNGRRPLLALPGGGSPRHFLPLLFAQNLDWPGIDLTLTDERWCDPGQPGSNQYLIESLRRATPAAAARLQPLYNGAATPAEAAGPLSAALDARLPPFITILGMGADGHIASLFGPAVCEIGKDFAFIASQDPGGMPRLSMSFHTLTASTHLFLFFGGPDKQAAFEGTAQAGLPVRRLLAARPDTQVFCY